MVFMTQQGCFTEPANGAEEYQRAIVVKYDSYGIPYFCANYDVPQEFTLQYFHGTAVGYQLPGSGITIKMFGPGDMTVAYLAKRGVDSEKRAFQELKLTAAACEELGRRTFDPATDQYMTPEEMSGQECTDGACPYPRTGTHDHEGREPRTPSPSGDSQRYRDPLQDLPPDAQGL